MIVKRQSVFDSIRESISENFSLQSKFCEEVTTFIHKEYNERKNRIEVELKDEIPENKDSIWKYHYPFDREAPELFRDLFLKSAFLTCYGLYESYLREITDTINSLKITTVKPYRVGDLENLLSKKAMNGYTIIRNILIHNNSIFTIEKQFKKFDLSNFDIEIRSYENKSQIYINSNKFNINFINESSEFLRQLIEAIEKKLDLR